MNTKAFFLFLIVTSFASPLIGQIDLLKDNSMTTFDHRRMIEFSQSSEVEEVKITIKGGTKEFDLQIKGTVHEGELTVEILDSKGAKKGNFTIETQVNSAKHELVSGNYRKALIEPQQGQWTIRITPKNATGNIQIQTKTLQ